jgi:hypothetical protein
MENITKFDVLAFSVTVKCPLIAEVESSIV